MNYIGRNPRPNYNNKYRVKRRFPRKRTFKRSFGKKRWPISRYATKNPMASGEPMKTLDIKFAGNIAIPYAPDSNTPTNLNIDTTGCYQNLTCIQQGVGTSQRIGNKVKLHGLKYRFEIDSTAVVNNNVSYMRLMFLYDRQPGYNQTTTSYYWPVNQILQDSRQDNVQVSGVYDSNISSGQMERFVNLSDRLIALPPWDNLVASDTVGPTAMNTYVYEGYIKLRGMETVYNSTSAPAVIANVTTGALIILVYGDTAAAASAWSLTGIARLRFQDC